jgi:hypothetical protein
MVNKITILNLTTHPLKTKGLLIIYKLNLALNFLMVNKITILNLTTHPLKTKGLLIIYKLNLALKFLIS